MHLSQSLQVLQNAEHTTPELYRGWWMENVRPSVDLFYQKKSKNNLRSSKIQSIVLAM